MPKKKSPSKKPLSQPKQLKVKFKRTISPKQKAALQKGQNLMKKAVDLQRRSGVITKSVKSGGRIQKIDVFKLPLNKALKRVK